MTLPPVKEIALGPLPDGWHVCPNCDGNGSRARAFHPDGFCTCCKGEGIVAEEQYQRYGRITMAFNGGMRGVSWGT